MRFKLYCFFMFVMPACAPQMSKISGRSPELFDKQNDYDPSVEGGSFPKMPGLYVKEPRISIQPTSPQNDSGSLASPDDDRLHLFTDQRSPRIGRFIPIIIASNKADSPKESNDNQGGTASNTDDKSSDNPNEKKPDALEEELLKTLPDLAPDQKGKVKLLKQFKMQVMHRYPNGDVLARVSRSSSNPDMQEEFVAEAKIPSDRLTSGDPLTTEDLVDVRVTEQMRGEAVERRSTGWEDEYSLRLSGFTEAKSRAGLDLEEKRKELKEVRDRLEQRIKAFATEKKQFATQRDQFKKDATAPQEVTKSQPEASTASPQSKVSPTEGASRTPQAGNKANPEDAMKKALDVPAKGGSNG